MTKKVTSNSIRALRRSFSRFWQWVWRDSLWRRFLFIASLVIAIIFGSMYGIARWYIDKHSHEPLVVGATFIPSYAKGFGLDPDQTLQAMLEPASQGGLGLKEVRLVSYWESIEAVHGKYNFQELDREFALANRYGAKVSLAIGLRQPRWPECHQPSWVSGEPKSTWEPQLYSFITAVIDHYKTNPALASYQLENEFFMKIFGNCTDFDRSRLIAEAALVKQTDPDHTLIISRSDNWIGLPIGKPTPDKFGISIYKRVWDYHFTHRYAEYPLPSWFYSFLAGAGEILTGKDMMIHELQSEPWLPPGQNLNDPSTINEQAKSLNPHRLNDRINYAKDTGIRNIELWGAEYWYYMLVKHNDSSYWSVVQQAVKDANIQNQKLSSNQLE